MVSKIETSCVHLYLWKIAIYPNGFVNHQVAKVYHQEPTVTLQSALSPYQATYLAAIGRMVNVEEKVISCRWYRGDGANGMSLWQKSSLLQFTSFLSIRLA